MANEFRIKNGFRSEGNSEVTGSLNVSNGITGSLQGTASWAETAQTASYILHAISSSYAATSSYTADQGAYFPGVISGSATWTQAGNGTITLPTVNVALYNNPDHLAPLYIYSVTGGTSGTEFPALANNDTNYIYIKYNSGSPTWDIDQSGASVNDSDTVLVYIVYRANNFIHILDFGNEGSGLANKISARLRGTERFGRESGLTLGLSGSNGVVTISSGVLWNGTNKQNVVATNSESDIFFKNFHSGSVWVYNTSGNYINNSYYDNGITTASIDSGKYLTNWYYRGQEVNDHIYEVFSQAQYDSVAAAQLATEPILPELLSSHAVLVGRIIIQSGSTSGLVESAFTTVFQATNVTAHNDTTGIQGGTAGQYYHLNATQYNNVAYTNIDNTFTGYNQISGSFTGSLQGTASYVAATGLDTQIQYNSGGSFAATASFAFIHTSQSLQQGFNTVASGLYSHAEGYITTARGESAHAEGASTNAFGNYSHTEGSFTSTGGTNGYLATSVTTGTASLSASYGDISFYFTNGSYLYLDDTLYDYAYGTTAVVIDSASFDGTSTLIFLQDPSVTTTTAVVGDMDSGPAGWTGDQTYAASHAHAEGTNSTALGQYSHAEGNSVFSIGITSHAEGRDVYTIGSYSHAEGLTTRTIGTYSHAEGRQTVAEGEASHAEGNSTRTKGLYSHAEGQDTIAIGDYSHVSGLGTIASASGQFVVGQYNTQGNTTSLFVIGAGANDGNRADIFRVSTTTVNVLGNLTVTSGITGSLQGTASFATNSVSASYVNGMVVKSGLVKGNSFSGSPLVYSVTFATAFPSDYTVTVTGGDARSWTVENKGLGGFKINSNSSVAISNDVFWQAIRTGEFNM